MRRSKAENKASGVSPLQQQYPRQASVVPHNPVVLVQSAPWSIKAFITQTGSTQQKKQRIRKSKKSEVLLHFEGEPQLWKQK